MDQVTLIIEAGSLINQAKDRVASGFPDQAKARLQSLRELLDSQLEPEARTDEQKREEGDQP